MRSRPACLARNIASSACRMASAWPDAVSESESPTEIVKAGTSPPRTASDSVDTTRSTTGSASRTVASGNTTTNSSPP